MAALHHFTCLSSPNQSMSACTPLSPRTICGIKRAPLCSQAAETNAYCVWLLKVKRARSATQAVFCSQLGGLAHSKLQESENGPAALFPWPYGVPAIRAGEGAAARTGLIINSKEIYIEREEQHWVKTPKTDSSMWHKTLSFSNSVLKLSLIAWVNAVKMNIPPRSFLLVSMYPSNWIV